MRACVSPRVGFAGAGAARRRHAVERRPAKADAARACVAAPRVALPSSFGTDRRPRWRGPPQSRGSAVCRASSASAEEARNTEPEDDESPARTYAWDSWDVFMSYGALASVLAVGSSGALAGQRWAYVPYFTSLAVCAIYVGAHRGLTRDFRETISFQSSLLGPFVLSAALFAAYVALEVLHLDLSVFVNSYFFVLGAVAVAGNAAEPLNAAGAFWREGIVKLPVPDGFAIDPVTRSPMKDAQIDVTPAQMVGVVVGVALATADLNANHLDFTLNNAIAACIVSDFLSVIGFGSFKSCATALCGLLAYDAFWVFKSEAVVGKNVMMSVAANASFNGPFRLLFPRFDDVLNPIAETAFPFSLLGLGDVAIPGLLIALMLRYDASRAGNLQARANAAADAFMEVFQSEKEEVASVENRFDENDASSGAYERDGYRTGIGKRAGDAAVAAYDDDSRTDAFDEPICVPSGLSGRAYFSSSLSAYVIGLLLAVAANVVTKEGQPALVYLVPTVLGVVAYVALGRGEADRVLDFEDETKDSLL